MRAPGVHATLQGVQFSRYMYLHVLRVEVTAGTAKVGDVMDALEVGGDRGGAAPASNANTSIIQHSMYEWF